MGRCQSVGDREDGVSRAMLGSINQSPTGHIFRPFLGKFSVVRDSLLTAHNLGPLDQKPISRGRCLLFYFTGGRTS